MVASPGRTDKPGQRVIIVNQAEVFNPATDTVADKVHPNPQGAKKMADTWFAALEKVLPKEEK